MPGRQPRRAGAIRAGRKAPHHCGRLHAHALKTELLASRCLRFLIQRRYQHRAACIRCPVSRPDAWLSGMRASASMKHHRPSAADDKRMQESPFSMLYCFLSSKKARNECSRSAKSRLGFRALLRDTLRDYTKQTHMGTTVRGS